MQIQLTNAGKRYNREWIFRRLNYHFNAGESYAINGPNGSGKSTLLQLLSGATGLSEGTINWTNENKTIAPETIYHSAIIVAPYLEVIEEMTATEFLEFHFQFKKSWPLLEIATMLDIVGLGKAADKQIRYFSSGMKQRVKLAQAFFTHTPLLLLDEPCTNLDASGYSLYHSLLSNYTNNRLVIVSSNDEQEYKFCNQRLDITQWK
jgi:ABC-type multidrug transport system ATPase subunit